MDLVIVRENEEDLYAGIEHQQTDEVDAGAEAHHAPGLRAHRPLRLRVRARLRPARRHCMTKDNIMKLTDGLFHRVFDEVAASTRTSRASTRSSTSARRGWRRSRSGST
jgi:isocitrate dehydrogenase